METYKSLCALLGRICLSAFFFWNAFALISDWDQQVLNTEVEPMILRILFLLGLALVQFVGGVSLLLGYGARLAALLLIVFITPVKSVDTETFLQTLAVIGGLLQVLAFGPGSYSIKPLTPKACVVDDEEEHRFLL